MKKKFKHLKSIYLLFSNSSNCSAIFNYSQTTRSRYRINNIITRFCNIFIVGVNIKFFILCFIIFLISSPILWNTLHQYQKQRLLTFFDPYKDPLETGYHIIQSEIAIGSGGFFGKGWLKGTQSHLDYLPEKKTGFIFSMLGEEFGFMGTISIIGLFILVCLVGYIISNNPEKDFFSKVVGISIITNFFLSAALNMAMVMGLTPVVGIPLPLVSFGGSSLVMTFFGIWFNFIIRLKP